MCRELCSWSTSFGNTGQTRHRKQASLPIPLKHVVNRHWQNQSFHVEISLSVTSLSVSASDLFSRQSPLLLRHPPPLPLTPATAPLGPQHEIAAIPNEDAIVCVNLNILRCVSIYVSRNIYYRHTSRYIDDTCPAMFIL